MDATQRAQLGTALRAETDPGVVAAIAARNDSYVTNWCNGLSATDAWLSSATDRDLFEATDVTKFDGLAAGKREAQSRMERFSPLDFTRQKMRKALQDIWGNADSVAVLQALRRKATRAEVYLGGNQATTNTVTALKLNFEGSVSAEDVGRALNGN